MPELPEVEILARHLRPAIRGRTIRRIQIRRERVLRPTTAAQFTGTLLGAKFLDLTRRGKYLLFQLQLKNSRDKTVLLGHLGMTGRMFLARKTKPLPKHAAVVLDLGAEQFVFEDTRYFGRLTLDLSPIETLGPEPLNGEFTVEELARGLKRSRQAVKVKLLDQSLVAGVGNIYASEALFRAGISPRIAANRLTPAQVKKLWRAIRAVLAEAVEWGSTVPLNFGAGKSDGLFYYGRAADAGDFFTERLRVYDRSGQPCARCAAPIRRIVQGARSTFFCARCQKS